ncbi:quinone-dependent dihydroorotate dehydrogenase [Candidatus Pantoea edessiphila]|uniref:Dihydroorotate dehydrogenase (quinone) n=1 Tax=Candidatus Pantoea edessiphila TaxID=2044610 RepID=A0A2P5SX10_9GAMM|nr:quinone-dependent dihydroorotate dehydrogenase [Candidatus Pantoea edessiphila]PPI86854.1 dihydroorotate dehydrogenase (quinone) [Candidatus Pantoea edessiphila]
MIYYIIRSILFKLDPELTHKFIIKKLSIIGGTPLEKLFQQRLISRPIKCMGLIFKNSLGLAAGLDKNAECIDFFGAMGFGFIEVGTVTPVAQIGNKKPRLFHLIESEGIINRMGFNNLGVDNLVHNVKKSKFKGVIGINIGKNEKTDIEQSKDDYLICIKKVYSYADYIAINISSPNTPLLRSLQYGEILDDLLNSVKNQQKELAKSNLKYVPIVIKISPDLSEEEIIKIADSLLRYKIDGVIATNTSINRSLVNKLKHAEELGGLSGRPLQLISNKVIQSLVKELKGRIPIIGVGGIDSLIAAREKIAIGASLIQIYSGLIYKGPNLIRNIINYI